MLWVGKKGVSQCVLSIQKGLFFSRNGNDDIHDLEVRAISLFWLAEGIWTGSGVSREY